MTEMTNLKPCPFCGWKASLVYREPVSCVVCRKCGAMGAMARDSYEVGDGKEKAIEVVEQWSEEHPSKTRQSVFLEQWPNAELDCEGDIAIEPCTIDMTMYSKENGCFTLDSDCEKCRREFWRQEVE